MSGTTTTPYLGLTKPAVGASRDIWGALLNADLDIIDQIVGTGVPIGAIFDFAGPTAPPGFLVCDGRLVSRVTYAALFAVISTYWGAGDGSTTFALPNPNGRAGIGPGTVIDQNGNTVAFSFAQTAGLLGSSILQANLPNYNLGTDVQGLHSHGGATAFGANHTHSIDSQGTHTHSGNTGFDSVNHTHSGTTDTQGNHVHSVTSRVASPAGGTTGAYQIYGGGFGWDGAGTDAQGNHAHNFTTGGISASHTHQIFADGLHTHNLGYSGNLQLGISSDGNHQHNVWLGGSGALFSLVQPVMVVTKIIYAGQQAISHTTALAAPTAAEAQDELTAIRQELAQLRAFLAPPRPQRLLRAPLRGSH